MFNVVFVGGGAAGFFGAIQLASRRPDLKIAILERGKTVLSKVKISGGGRCNITHAAFDPKELVVNYPRGEKELLGPFHQFSAGDVMQFFEERGVPLKIEDDGRIFPLSDSSQSIIDCFLAEAAKYNIEILKNSSVKQIIAPLETEDNWQLVTNNKTYLSKNLVLSTGSNPKIWEQLKSLGHTISTPVPSLFTFNIKDTRIDGLQGVATQATVKVLNPTKLKLKGYTIASKNVNHAVLEETGPVLIAHWGLTGPAILRLSAWGALVLNQMNYQFTIQINWLPDYTSSSLLAYFKVCREQEPKKTILKSKVVDMPKRLWNSLVKSSGILASDKWADANNDTLKTLAKAITETTLAVNGKSTFKDEFVTAGGVALTEVNFKTMESKVIPRLYFAGEIINVDAITGGFNFQNAWTTAYLAAKAIAEKI
ncbi:BaiN/RdsA family NAD(P)/FAD-dependent oxidoreductase [Croceivirga radicis]|uniref:NAD(P)/FAD-dependent oxidoreductase n=1 Tax=Croceivirga radicis TaxID=1929488 RepID=UPI000255B0D6|nr:NAD(P)/FAD-dependent oxidoreductase [Croceivirga radicis]